MSRGTFNGPGGTHNRWQVPNEGGSGLGPHHLLHFKNQLGVLTPADQVTLERNTLHEQGIAVVRLKAREAVPATATSSASRSTSAPAATSRARARTRATPGRTSSTARTAIGPELPALPRRGRRPGRQRLVRAGPRRPHLEEPQQQHAAGLADRPASGGHRDDRLLPPRRHAGAGRARRPAAAERRHVPRRHELRAASTSTSTTFNRLHFYVLAKHRDADGALSYDVGVRRLRRCRPVHARRLARESGDDGTPARLPRDLHVPARQHGPGGDGRVRLGHLPLAASRAAPNWKVTLPNALAAVKAGQTVQVPVHVLRDPARTGRRAHDRDADGEVGGGPDEDGDAHVQRARPRHDARRVRQSPGRCEGGRRPPPWRSRPRARRAVLSSPAAAATTRRRAGPQTCRARARRDDVYATRRRCASRARVLRRAPRRHGDAARPSCGGSARSCSCSRPAGAGAAPTSHREAAARGRRIRRCGRAARDSRRGRRREPALEYADELDLGHPIAAGPERVWLNYAAREPPVVVLDLARREGRARLAGRRLARGAEPPARAACDSDSPR